MPDSLEVFRAASTADLTAVVELAALTFPYSAPAGSDPANINFHIANYLNADRFAEYIAQGTAHLLLAEKDGTLRGYSLLLVQQPQDPDVRKAVLANPTAELSKCYVHPEEHGSGLAARLMAQTLAIAKAEGATTVWLGVSSVNERAKRFYQKQGFRSVGKKYFMFGDEQERDDVLEVVL